MRTKERVIADLRHRISELLSQHVLGIGQSRRKINKRSPRFDFQMEISL